MWSRLRLMTTVRSTGADNSTVRSTEAHNSTVGSTEAHNASVRRRVSQHPSGISLSFGSVSSFLQSF